MIVDLFAGPGGWSEGLRMLSPELHATEVGLEWDAAACATREAAGHRTIQTDIAAYPTEPFAGAVGLIASPPCQDFSTAGKGAGITGERGQLITQVLRWAEALTPEWIACEQVPPALPVWHQYAEHLRNLGFSTWAGVLNAADYGVPQTRRRAFLLASRVCDVQPPAPTHAQHPEPSLFGDDLAPWVTMADALGWGRRAPMPPICSGTHGATDEFLSGGASVRRVLRQEIAAGEWVVNTGCLTGGNGREAALEFDAAAQPSVTVTGKSGGQWWIGPEQVRLTPADALVLQSFPADYPVSGTKTRQFEQIGNAVPPLLAAHVLAAVTGVPLAAQS